MDGTPHFSRFFAKSQPTYAETFPPRPLGCNYNAGGKVIFRSGLSIVGENIHDNEFSLAGVLDKKSLSVQSFVDEAAN